MPELPEVQTVVNDLNKKVIGEQIVGVWSDWKKNIRPSFSKFKKEVDGAKIKKVRRIGKHIVIDLETSSGRAGKKSIVIHLKMSGHLLFKQKNWVPGTQKNKYFDEKVNQYIRHKLVFSARGGSASGGKSGSTLEFSDLRKFGWMNLVDTNEVENLKEISKLGIDALDTKFTLEVFNNLLTKKQKSIIGLILLDQSFVAGIGNIYRSEILFDAGVLPQRKVSSLSKLEIEKIFKSIIKILKKAVKMRGTTDADYRDTDGKAGNFQNVLMVYRREGEKCKFCGTKIIREKMGQRSAFYCPVCQK